MITIDGISGKGSVWATSNVESDYAAPKGTTDNLFLDRCLPVTEWYLPKPDGLWYPTNLSAYGPRVTELEIGALYGANDPESYNPCLHRTVNGSAIYRGLNGSSGPFWTYDDHALNAYCKWNKSTQMNEGRLTTLSGRPSKSSSSMKVYDRYGVKVSASASTSNLDLWYRSTVLPLTVAPDSIQSLLPEGNSAYKYGQWYARKGQSSADGLRYTQPDPAWSSHYVHCTWRRASANVFIRTLTREYHDSNSLIPESSVSSFSESTGLGYLYSAEQRVDTFSVTHVTSPAPGLFRMRYDYTTVCENTGFSFPSPWSSSATRSYQGNVSTIMVLEPGSSLGAEVETEHASRFCELAMDRAKLLFKHQFAKSVRTIAIGAVDKLESNWIENLSQVKGTSSIIAPLLLGFGAYKKHDLSLAKKALASAYLTYQYAIAPNVRDYKDVTTNGARLLGKAGKNRFSDERRRGRSIWTTILGGVPIVQTYTCSYHLKLRTDVFSSLWVALERFGIDPTVSNVWDCVPFSFVADWFYNIGDALSVMDSYNSAVLHYDCIANVEGYKVQWPLEDDEVRIWFDRQLATNGGPLTFSWYDRRVSQELGSVDPFSGQVTDGITTSQMVQSGALLTSFGR